MRMFISKRILGLPNFYNWAEAENEEMTNKPKKYKRDLIFLFF